MGEILVSDELLDAGFACNLGACLGACCVQGDSGAPLLESELSVLEELVPILRKDLRPEAISVIEHSGPWEMNSDGTYSTTCVEGRECVFVSYDGDVAHCALHAAHIRGKTEFPKPISCHLFPVREADYGTYTVLNYEQIDMCAPARVFGRRSGVALVEFLREPLVRRFGQEWYDDFVRISTERRKAIRGV